MAGLVPAIHVFRPGKIQDVDARDKRGHDDFRTTVGSIGVDRACGCFGSRKTGVRNERMRCLRLHSLFLAIVAVIFFAAHAQARERPVFCDPPSVTVVARGAIVGGRLCNGPWGCRCAHWFCPQCSTLPSGPLSCEWTTCAPLSGPPRRGR
jgi:hypothetical protein